MAIIFLSPAVQNYIVTVDANRIINDFQQITATINLMKAQGLTLPTSGNVTNNVFAQMSGPLSGPKGSYTVFAETAGTNPLRYVIRYGVGNTHSSSFGSGNYNYDLCQKIRQLSPQINPGTGTLVQSGTSSENEPFSNGGRTVAGLSCWIEDPTALAQTVIAW